MFQDPEEFVPPDYIDSGCSTLGGCHAPLVQLYSCTFCSSVVLDKGSHTDWHLHLWIILKKIGNM